MNPPSKLLGSKVNSLFAGPTYPMNSLPLQDTSSWLSPDLKARAVASPLSSFFIQPTRIVWQSETGVENAGRLLQPQLGQSGIWQEEGPCVLTAQDGKPASIVLDFGSELHGAVELFTASTEKGGSCAVRVRFGESVSEAMSEVGEKGAQNDHATRDMTINAPWLGKTTLGPSGFRFVRIDALDPEQPLSLVQVQAVLIIRDIPQLGAFRCNDERLNEIWQVGAYTVHLNMQEYLWDGIKRDRLVWIGDMHPEVSTINAVFGFNDVVTRSLDATRDRTPASEWMNGISSYSMWWILIHEQLWVQHGDREYLYQQEEYLRELLKNFVSLVDSEGREQIDGVRFLDWPSSPNEQGVTAGLQALTVMTLEAGAHLLAEMDDYETATLCRETAQRARKIVPDANGSKSGAALQVLAGLRDAKETSDQLLKVGGALGVSTFYGYYVLKALSRAGDTADALDIVRTYWGAMLDRGATTFWEDFNLEWLEGSSRIDEIVPDGLKDLHGDYGDYCYQGFRHSLCHGWASGPTAWMSEYVLGFQPQAHGCQIVSIAPQLGDLEWAEGRFPTPQGIIEVRHERREDGLVYSTVNSPDNIQFELVGAQLVN